MQEKERIKVYADIQNGKTVCICHRNHKGCGKPCKAEEVERDKFKGWQQVMRRDRYGK